MRLLVIALAVGTLAATGADATTTTAPAQAASPSTTLPRKADAIGVTDAAARVEEVRGRLEAIEAKAEPTAPTAEIAVRLPALVRSVDAHAAADREQLAGRIDLAGLDAIEAGWADDAASMADWDQKLRRRAEELDALVVELKALTDLWQRTRESLQNAEAPSALLERIRTTLATIADTRTRVAKRRDEMLTQRNQVARQRAVVTEMRRAVEERRKQLLGRLWSRDQPPLWTVLANFRAADIAARVGAVLSRDRDDLSEFVRGERPGRWSAVLMLLALTAGTIFLATRARRWQAEGVDLGRASLLVERPFSSAMAMWILVLVWMPMPLAVRRMATVIVVVPVLRLLGPLLGPAAVPVIGFVAVTLVLDRMQDVFTTVPEVGRLIFLLEMAIALVAVLWARRRWVVAPPRETVETSPETPAAPAASTARTRPRLEFLAGLAATLVVVAATADVFGFTQFAAVVGSGVVISARWALATWVVGNVLEALIVVGLRTRPLRALYVVRRNPARVARRMRRLVRWGLTALWAMLVLQLFRVWTPLVERGGDLLAAELKVGAVELSLADVLVFGLGVVIAIALSRVVHVVLEEEVLSRVQLPRGIPYAISTFAGYVVLLLGLVTALGAAGLDLSRVSLILSALGVGIGFGLQEVVKDFVAGTVLLFERSIQIGDIVDVGTLSGDVRRIGLRSSTVHTADGAEVIVPNSLLTSGQIVNWTLSDRMRRIELPVGVAYGTDPHRVVALLVEVARKQKDILEDPEPIALFTGFGAASLDFSVRAWTLQVDQYLSVRSALAMAVHEAFAEAGITVPLAQRVVRVQDVAPGDKPPQP